MSEPDEPDWLAELAKGGEVMRRQVEPIVQAAMQLARLEWPKSGRSLGVPLPLRLAAAVNAATRELGLPKPVVHQVTLSGTITMSGSLALSPMRFVASADATNATKSEAVQKPQLLRGVAALSDGQIVFLVLLWLYAFALPWFATRLPPECHEMLSDSYATLAIGPSYHLASDRQEQVALRRRRSSSGDAAYN